MAPIYPAAPLRYFFQIYAFVALRLATEIHPDTPEFALKPDESTISIIKVGYTISFRILHASLLKEVFSTVQNIKLLIYVWYKLLLHYYNQLITLHRYNYTWYIQIESSYS